MKHFCLPLIIVFTVFSLVANSQDQQRNLEYVSASNGLSYPDWEGGRTEIEFGDMNDDGLLDMVSIGDHGSPFVGTSQHGVMVWLGDGTGSWSVVMNGDFGYGGVAIGDVDNDGYWDVGYGMHHNYSSTDLGDQLIEVALGDGTASSWTPWDDGLATAGEDWGMFGTDFGDVDNDGDLDLGSCSFGSGAGVQVYLNNMDGSWTHSFGFLGGNCDMLFEFGDINNDGFLDFCVSHEYGTIYFGDGTGDFVLKDENLPSSGGFGRMGTSLGDVDGNGGKDLAYININGGIKVWVWNDLMQQWIDYSGNLPEAGDYEMTQLFDMNNDGYTDIAAFGDGQFRVWAGNGTGNWTEAGSFTTPPRGSAQAFRVGGDIDNNGYADIAIVAEEGSWPSYQNKFYCYKETSPVFTLAIRPEFPYGKELFWQNCIRDIRWRSSVPTGLESWVDLEYSVTGEEGPWYSIASGLPNNGRYQWQVPLENSLDCYIKYTVYTESGQSSSTTPAAFTITDGTASTGPSLINEQMPELVVFPNPVSEEATIQLSNLSVNNVQIILTDVRGRKIAVFDNVSGSSLDLGIRWNCTDMNGNRVKNGCYFLKVITEDRTITRKIIVSDIK